MSLPSVLNSRGLCNSWPASTRPACADSAELFCSPLFTVPPKARSSASSASAALSLGGDSAWRVSEPERLLHDERAQALRTRERLADGGLAGVGAERLGDEPDVALLAPGARMRLLLAEEARDRGGALFARAQTAAVVAHEACRCEPLQRRLGGAAPLGGREAIGVERARGRARAGRALRRPSRRCAQEAARRGSRARGHLRLWPSAPVLVCLKPTCNASPHAISPEPDARITGSYTSIVWELAPASKRGGARRAVTVVHASQASILPRPCFAAARSKWRHHVGGKSPQALPLGALARLTR